LKLCKHKMQMERNIFIKQMMLCSLSISLSDITIDGQNELSARHIKRRFKLKKKIKYNIICTDCIKCFIFIFILFNKFYMFLFLLNINFNKQNITILNISIYILLILTMLVRVVQFTSYRVFPLITYVFFLVF